MIIDQLPLLGGDVQATDEFPIERGTTTYKATPSQIFGYVFAEIEPNFAGAYDSAATYAVGDYVVYEHTLYVCNTAIPTAEQWTAAHWTQVDIGTVLQSKQDKITASGILKGDGSGGVSAAVAGTDYLTQATNYSPLKQITNPNYSIAATDKGETICPEYSSLLNVNATVTLTQEVSTQFPNGTEIAFFWKDSSYLHLAFSGGIKTAKAGDETYSQNAVYNIAERFSIVGIKKVGFASQGDWWIVQGNVEVVT